MRIPSTWTIADFGSTRMPWTRTCLPSTSTRPSSMSCSQARRLPSPAAASTCCSRIALLVVGGGHDEVPAMSSRSSMVSIAGSSGASSGSSSSERRPIRSRKYDVVRYSVEPPSPS